MVICASRSTARRWARAITRCLSRAWTGGAIRCRRPGLASRSHTDPIHLAHVAGARIVGHWPALRIGAPASRHAVDRHCADGEYATFLDAQPQPVLAVL